MNSGEFIRKDVTRGKPGEERIFMGIEDRTNMDRTAGAEVDNYSWECQNNDEMTWMTQQQEAGNMSNDRCTKK